MAQSRQVGDIEVTNAKIRINRVGLGPDSDAKIQSLLDFTDAISKSPLMPITDVGDLAQYLGSLFLPSQTGDAGNIVQQWRSIMNENPPFEAYVSFDYKIYLGDRSGLSRWILGKEIWVNGSSIVNDRVLGPHGGLFIDQTSARNASINRLSSHWNEAANNFHARMRRWKQ